MWSSAGTNQHVSALLHHPHNLELPSAHGMQLVATVVAVCVCVAHITMSAPQKHEKSPSTLHTHVHCVTDSQEGWCPVVVILVLIQACIIKHRHQTSTVTAAAVARHLLPHQLCDGWQHIHLCHCCARHSPRLNARRPVHTMCSV